MKYKLFYPIIIILIICGGVIGWSIENVSANEKARIWLTPERLNLAPGDEGTLEIRVENVTHLAGAEVHLTFDSSLLEIKDAYPETEGVQITHGDFLSPDFVVQNSADPSNDKIDYTIACMPIDKAVSGSGVLARITFNALTKGESLMKIRSALLSDKQSQPIEAELESSVVVIEHSSQSPMVWALIGLVAVSVTIGLAAVVWQTIKNSKNR